ncbi:hypothetical protein M3O96_01410 [Aquiflexum sp. TKW24L]|uniref:hypothetical protein n=1 Tax=Aquiflexum sp. TKW24L TaxID=2942212 RepID=UPI0020BD62BE|nr:hypothetical protein [Aquiflexum sp. TKW24L]MCL6257726.1 hypothetical protein [Aquiflexum sp. TKW24L]
MKKKIILISIILLAAAGLILFNGMGGFNEVQLEVIDTDKIDLLGRHFKGIPQDEKLGKAFQEMEKIKNATPGSTLHTIYFAEPAGKLDTMEVFVGLESQWMDKKIDFDQVSYSGEKAIVASIKAHRFVMPSPLKIKNKIIDFAQQNGLPEPDIFIDQIIGLDEVKVIGITSKKSD